MVYEIEKRSIFTSKVEFNKCQSYVKKHAKFIDKYAFKSFLFRSLQYLRIRIVKGKKEALITKKLGTYQDISRIEQNQMIKMSALKDYLKQLESKGFKECVCIKTISNAYQLDDLRIDFNKITYLGMIVEVEVITENKSEIHILEEKISKTMNRLKLTELDSKTYQYMINEMYSKGLKPISKQNFSI